MATDKPRVAGYVSQELKNLFQAFTQERGLSESKAMAVLLTEYFGVSQEVTHPSSLDLVRRIEAIEQKMEAHLVSHSNSLSTKAFAVPKTKAKKAVIGNQLGLAVDKSGPDSPPARPDGQRWLSTSQAFERAVIRGCERNKNGFKGWSQRKPDECLAEYQLRRIENVPGHKRSSTAPGYEDMDWENQVEF